MSAFGTKRTSLFAAHMSAFGGKADITCHNLDSSVARDVSWRADAPVGLPIAPMRRTEVNARLGFGLDPAARTRRHGKGTARTPFE